MDSKKSISKEFFLKLILITIIVITLAAYWEVANLRRLYRRSAQSIHEQQLYIQKAKIKSEVDKIVFWIEQMQQELEKSKFNDPQKIQAEVLKKLSELRYDSDGYFFGSTYNGDPLFSNGKITKDGESLWNLVDPNGVKIMAEYLKAIENPEGDYIYYYWNKIGQNESLPKISFVKAIPEWNWIIGTGAYLQDIQKTIDLQKEELRQDINNKLLRWAVFLFVLLVFLYWIAKSTSRKIKQEFDVFLNAFANPEKGHKDIDPQKFSYRELSVLANSAKIMLKEQMNTKNILQENEKQLQNIIDENPNLIFVKNRKGEYLLANKAMANSFGMKPEQLQGKTDFDVMPQNRAQKYREEDLKILKGKADKLFLNEEFTAKDGITRFMYTIKKTIKIANSKELALLGISVNVTELKKIQNELKSKNKELEQQIRNRKRVEESLEDSRRQMWNIINNSTNIFYSYTANHKVTFVSPQIEAVLGYKPREVLINWTKLISDNPVNEEAKIKTELAIKTGKAQDPYEVEMIHKNGSKVWVEAREAPVKTDDTVVIVGSLTDITARKVALRELKKHQDSLEQMVTERTSELQTKTKRHELSQQALSFLLEDVNEMRAEVEELNEDLIHANSELEAFSYSVSHDLRAPLRAINGFATILKDEYNEILDAKAFEYIEIVRSNAITMSELINDLLEFSRVSRKELNHDKFDIQKEFKRVMDDVKKHNIDLNITAEISEMTEIHADKKMIRQVIYNLLSNAVKYSSKRKKIKIDISMTDEEKDYVFHVKDNGVGFDEKYVSKLFGVFQRLHTPEEFEGTGVGLAIVKRIIKKHNGKVWANSKLDKGATFHFALPKKYKEKEEKMTQAEINIMAQELMKLEEEYSLDLFDPLNDDE